MRGVEGGGFRPRPIGQVILAPDFRAGGGLPGAAGRNGQQQNRGIISSNPFEARIQEFLEQDWNMRGWGIEYFSPSYRMYSHLLVAYHTKLKGYGHGDYFLGNVPEDASPETIEEMRNLAGQTAIALGILAYPQWGAKLQKEFRKKLQTMGGVFFCEVELSEYKQYGYIDWENWQEHDHNVKLPEAGRQLLKHITNVVGIPCDVQQDTFLYSTVLDRPEPTIAADQ